MRQSKFLFLFVAMVLMLSLFSACNPDGKPVFERFEGLDKISRKGLSDIWDMSESSQNEYSGENVTITILESYYNNDAIWIGYKLEGKAIIRNGSGWGGPVFSYNGERVNIHWMDRGLSNANDMQYMVSMAPQEDIRGLPDEFTLKVVFSNKYIGDRDLEFLIPLKRSEQEVTGNW